MNQGIALFLEEQAIESNHLQQTLIDSLYLDEQRLLETLLGQHVEVQVTITANEEFINTASYSPLKRRMKLFTAFDQLLPSLITHEHTHFVQCEEKRLIVLNEHECLWGGTNHRFVNAKEDFEAYVLQGWELEAYQRQCRWLLGISETLYTEVMEVLFP